jgi:hypothetical protein
MILLVFTFNIPDNSVKPQNQVAVVVCKIPKAAIELEVCKVADDMSI